MDIGNRIEHNMTLEELLVTMCAGSFGALSCMVKLIETDPVNGFLDILFLDYMGIYGSKIYTIWHDCCGRDMRKFRKTLRAFRDGKYTKEEINKNISLSHPRPFI